MGFIILATLLALGYLILQLFYLYHWLKTDTIEVPVDFIPSTAFSVVVVAHDEEDHIEQCLRGILQQHYPNDFFEVIIIDDRSSDKTAEKIMRIQSEKLRLFHLQDYPDLIHAPAYKKSAIELAVLQAHHDWIVMTDADCVVTPEWLRTIAYAQSLSNAVFLTAPICYKKNNSFLEKMQQMEIMIFMIITAAGIRSRWHDMSNGANMAFSKSAFLEVGGYEGNYQYASGDDMFLIEKMRSDFPDKISFVKSIDAIVDTAAQQDWSSLIKQRIRWAGKNKGLKSPVIRIIWSFVGFYHFMIFVMFLLAIIHISSWWPFIILLLIKWFADALIIYQASFFYKVKSWLADFVPLQLMYWFYILRLGLGMMMGKKSDW
jgi:cellulose synthase/poly-beta-1,6-N-acetylglucosamine synthase-like glycosyltransferase